VKQIQHGEELIPMTTKDLLHLIDDTLLDQDIRETVMAYQQWDAIRRRRIAEHSGGQDR
jgi:hypothetical protein